jgi:uncharacterized protein (TIGR02646 family)
MIPIQRSRVDEHGRPIEPNAAWFSKALLEASKTATHASHEVSDHYRDAEVKKALEKLFHDKCAYCETNITASSDWDVEHYRPKGRVAERADHTGYYWLAYEWTNLLPSCSHCNQRRKDQPLFDDPTTGPAAGKGDQFPLRDETTRAMLPTDDLSLEEPLLLDPTRTDPSALFTFNPKGQIVPRPAFPGDKRPAETRRICHLYRRRLRKRRFTVIGRVRQLVEALRQAEGMGAIQATLELLMESFVGDGAEYAAVARAVRRDPGAFPLPPPAVR